MNEEKRVGTRCITFHVTVLQRSVTHKSESDMTTCETIGNYGKGIIPAHVQKDFAKKVEHALQVFADTLEASFKEESTDVQQKA